MIKTDVTVKKNGNLYELIEIIVNFAILKVLLYDRGRMLQAPKKKYGSRF